MAAPTSLGALGLNTVSEAIAFATGFAAGRALEPIGVALGQKAWEVAPIRAVDAGTAATIVAEFEALKPWGIEQAKKHGIDEGPFKNMVDATYTAPGVGELLRILRRHPDATADFVYGLRKGKLEARWDALLEDLQHERLDPAVIATAVQRGILANAGLLPVGPPTSVGKVPPMPQVGLDVLAEAAASGVSEPRLAVLARIVGLPASPDLAARMVFRKIIEPVDFDRAISEGNTRNEWAPFLFEGFRQILTAHDYVEARLRGWIDDAAMLAGTAKHGMSPADTELLFKTTGRPIPVHQITTGEARGGAYNAPHDAIPAAYLKSLEESNQRPEWYSLSYANRYTYPSAFVLRTLATTGELAPADVEKTLLEIGWRPDFAAKVTKAWTGGTKLKADPHVAKAETQLWGTLHKSYLNDETDATLAGEVLTEIGVAAAAQTRVLALWDQEKRITRRELTPSQVKKAYKETKITRDDALERLLDLGYTAADAATLLDE